MVLWRRAADSAWWTFWADYQVYWLRRFEVRRAITFGGTYVTPPMVWGRGVTGGGITPSDPNAQVHWTGVVEGSVTTDIRVYGDESADNVPGAQLAHSMEVQ